MLDLNKRKSRKVTPLHRKVMLVLQEYDVPMTVELIGEASKLSVGKVRRAISSLCLYGRVQTIEEYNAKVTNKRYTLTPGVQIKPRRPWE